MAVYLHIGAPKTGTTYLQHVLSSNRRGLAKAGVCYPGSGPDHFHAAQDLLGIDFGGWPDPGTEGAWGRVASEVTSWSGPSSVVSHELLSNASEDTIRAAADAVGADDVHVIYTARDLGRLVPAMWQESLKNRGTMPMRKMVRRLRRQAGSLGSGTFAAARAVNPAGVLERWAAVTGPERIHVVVLGRGAPPDRLWSDVAGVLGVDPTAFDATAPSNPSLGVAEAELLRRLNRLVGKDALDWPDYHRLVKNELAQQVLAARADSARITLPEADRAWLREWAHGQVEALRSAGYDVVGNLAEIVPPEQGEPTAKMREAEVNHAAVELLAHLVARLAERDGSSPADRLKHRLGAVMGRSRRAGE